MRLKYYLQKALSLPPHILFSKVRTRLSRKCTNFIRYTFDMYRPTYSLSYKHRSSKLAQYLNASPITSITAYAEQLRLVSHYFMEHRFDLLGSGWVKVYYGMSCRGLEEYRYKAGKSIKTDGSGCWLKGRINAANLRESRRIWNLIEPPYFPMDWQLDFKSGYRWREDIWYRSIEYGHRPGVDVKVPWELARMQHLPQLAWAFALASEGEDGFRSAEEYAREFRNQILDFIATNPPRYGVNWCCTMDVGIRVANCLIAYDMFRSFGARFDSEFEKVFARSVYEHGKHCLENLEYSPELRSNHYLSDIGGLLFAAAYLSESAETNRWLAFSIQEFSSEMNHEFNSDGSNFEGSTSYHRLSTEIMLYAAIICLALPDERRQLLKNCCTAGHRVVPPLQPYEKRNYDVNNSGLFPSWFHERLERAVEFTLNITMPDGRIPQFGDNDSGRFLKVWPAFQIMAAGDAVDKYRNLHGFVELEASAQYPVEEILDHRHLPEAAGVFFDRPDFRAAGGRSPETWLVSAFLGGKSITSYQMVACAGNSSAMKGKIGSELDLESLFKKLKKELGDPVCSEFAGNYGCSLTSDLVLNAYPDFGLYLYKSPSLYLAVRCGSIGQNGNGGHAHNDQLGIELVIGGRVIVRDPGTYLYTPLPGRRNQFRSTGVHFVPQRQGQEQNNFSAGREGLFSLNEKVAGDCLYFAENGFVGRHRDFYRVLRVNEATVAIYDFGVDEPCRLVDFYSDGYGRWIDAEKY